MGAARQLPGVDEVRPILAVRCDACLKRVICSLDQTTRIHGPWRRSTGTEGSSDLIETWHEISRPQIHGYDLIAATWLDSFRFVSVADEKVARVFDAPKGFVKTLEGLRTAEGSVAEAVSRRFDERVRKHAE